VVLNQRPVPSKFSSCDKRLNVFLGILFVFLAVACVVSAVMAEKWQGRVVAFYPVQETSDAQLDQWSWLGNQILNFFTFLILYGYVIPISLYVTLELQKFVGALFIGWDTHLYDVRIDEPAQARCSGWQLVFEL
jgi:magnesium-transporting ATPase (P-type)